MVEIPLAVTLESPRELKGLEILSKGDQIKRIDSDTYRVRSQSSENGSYLVTRNGKDWTCECPDHANRKVVCKHIWSVYFSLNLRQRVVTKVQTEIDLAKSSKEGFCRNCASENIVKIGSRHNLHGDVQRFLCNDCKKKFSDIETGFEKIKATPRAITVALDCYFKKMSQRRIVEHLKMFEGVSVTQPCIVKWIDKYIALMKSYLDKFSPQLGGIWHSDEMVINVRKTSEKIKVGRDKEERPYSWAWNLLDHETRFLLASEVTKHRFIDDAKKVLRKAKDVADGQRPDYIVIDKLPAYKDAINKEFFTIQNPRTKHVKLKSIREGTNNNIVERANGTVRERLKAMRGMDNDESAEKMLEGNRIYYNNLRPHQALEGKTPAEKAGIDLKLEGNKWKEVIQRAKRQKKEENLESNQGENSS